MNFEYRQALGQVLASKREAAGLSKQQLALMVGVNRLTVRKIETGEANPTVGILLRIVRGLGLSLADVMVECERLLQKDHDRPDIPEAVHFEVGPLCVHYFFTQL